MCRLLIDEHKTRFYLRKYKPVMNLEKLPLTWFINFLFIGYNAFFVVDRMLNASFPFAYLIKRIPVLRYWRVAVLAGVSQKRNFPLCLLVSIKRIKIRVK